MHGLREFLSHADTDREHVPARKNRGRAGIASNSTARSQDFPDTKDGRGKLILTAGKKPDAATTRSEGQKQASEEDS
jgi:hypothetical protein